MRALLSFGPLFMRHYRAFMVALLMAVVTVAAGVGLLAISGWFLTAAFLAGAGAAFNLFGPSSAVRGLSLLRILSRYGERMSGHDATLKALTQLRHWLFTRLMPNAGPLGKGLRRGDLIQRLTADVDTLDVVFLLAIGPMATALLAGSALCLVLWFVLPAAAIGYLGAFTAAAIGVPLLLTLATRRAGRDAVEGGLRANLGVTWTRTTLAEFSGCLGAGALLRFGTQFGVRQLAKLVPGYGTLIGGAAAGIASFATTYGLGRAAVLYLTARRAGNAFDAEAVAEEFRRAMAEATGAAKASRMFSRDRPSRDSSSRDSSSRDSSSRDGAAGK